VTTSGLSMDQAPPFSAPLRFFMTAPIFGILFSLGIIFLEPNFLEYKDLKVIGLIHLITIGFFGFTMLGALQQMLPVLAGVVIKKPTLLAGISHSVLTIGILLFSYGMIFENYPLIKYGTLMMFGGFFVLLTPFAIKLVRGSYSNPTINAIRFAIFSGFVTIFLGAYLGVSWGDLNFLDNHGNIVNLHIAFGNLGWVLILVIGIAFQVVPMFYVTPKYPKFCLKWPLLITIGLVIWGVYQLLYPDMILLKYLAYGIFGSGGTAFASVTIIRFFKRKRPILDTTIKFWLVSLVSLFIGTAIIIDLLFADWQMQTYTAGVLFFMGFGVALLNGMIYKIVPFLAWFHLSATGRFDIPTMRDFLPEKKAKIQFYFFMGSYIMFIGGVFFQELIFIAGILFLISNILLELNLIYAYRLYKGVLKTPIPEGFSWK
jgi:hypothetical protein